MGGTWSKNRAAVDISEGFRRVQGFPNYLINADAMVVRFDTFAEAPYDKATGRYVILIDKFGKRTQRSRLKLRDMAFPKEKPLA